MEAHKTTQTQGRSHKVSLKKEFGTDDLCELHRALCQSAAQKSGELRKVNIKRYGCACIGSKLLPTALENMFAQLNKTPTSSSKADFAAVLTHFMREMQILSPFAFGNDKISRQFFKLFAASRGFILDYRLAPPSRLSDALSTAFKTDDVTPLYKCVLKLLSRPDVTRRLSSPPAPRARFSVPNAAARKTRVKVVPQSMITIEGGKR
jgi:fido (protein-threonine AMPylation protein)